MNMSKQESAALADAVMACDASRERALLAADAVALRALVHDDLVYTHSTGRQDDTASYVRAVASGKARYRAMERTELRCRVQGDVAVLDGKVRMHVEIEGVEKRLVNRFMATWVLVDGTPRMFSWASTGMPLPASATP